jgi:hypothetical protein
MPAKSDVHTGVEAVGSGGLFVVEFSEEALSV